MGSRTGYRIVGLGLLAMATLACAADSDYVPGQSYTVQGRLERGAVTDPHYYFEVPCGPGSGSDRHSFTFRLQPVEQGPDIPAVFTALQPGQFVEAQGVYRGVLAAGPGTLAAPTLAAERLTPLPLAERARRFNDLHRLRRQ